MTRCMIRFALVPIALLLLCGQARPDAFTDALRLMAAGEAERAADRLADVARPGRAGAERAALLEARALVQAGEIEAAAGRYRRLLERLEAAGRGDAEAAQGARFGLAECLARQQRFAAAEKLFGGGLDALSADGYRLRLAERFLQLADEALQPSAGGREPEPARAERLYRAALEFGLPDERAAAVRLRVGHCLSEQGRHAEAAQHYQRWLADEAHGDSPLRAEVLLRAGRAAVEAHQQRQARIWLRDLLAEQPQAPQAAEAAYLMSRAWGMPTPGDAEQLAHGLAALQRFLADHPQHPEAAAARLELARAPMHLGRQAQAEDALRALIAEGAEATQLAEARYQLGVCLAAQGRYREAAAAFAAYLQRHPAHKFWSAARDGIEQMHWQRAQQARRLERWPEAAAAFAAFAEQHPGSELAPEGLYRAAEAQLEAERPDAALEALATLTSKFATHHWGWQGLLLTGRVLEQHQADFERARAVYRKAQESGSPVAGEAATRLRLLEKPSLLVESPENFRAGRPAQLVWHTRNIERVTVRAYRLQAEEYFRDRLDMGALTAVDIALCEPDRTWTVDVADYRPLARIEQRVELPFERPGLYLLSLTAGELEATTAVRISDLGLLVKTGAGEVFAFAQDRKRRRPWAGARILLSDGRRLLAEGTTAADGSWRTRLDSDQPVDQLRLLAIDGDQLAWSAAAAPARYEADQLSPRAFVFSDRPAYRPGDRVHLAGIYRDTAGDRFSYEPGWELELQVHDPAGIALFSGPVELDAYGAFHRAIELDASASTGSYGFSLQRGDGPVFSGRFAVHHSRRLAYRLEVDLDRPVLVRGEQLGGTVRVLHRHGAPAPDLALTVDLLGADEHVTGRSDENGELRFTFPTRAFEHSRRLAVRARLHRGQQMAEASALLAVTDFGLTLEPAAGPYFAGQPFGLTVRATGAAGGPRPASVTLEAVRRHPQAGGEVRVWQRRVQLGADGRAEVEVALAEEGGHVLRATARDRNDRPVVAETAVRTVGREAPGIWLELAEPVQVPGRPARVILHSRLERVLVLLTAETDRVLEHRALVVDSGATPIDWPIDADLAPNFLLAAAAIEGDRLHVTSRSVRVSRELNIALRSDRETYAPGAEVTLTLVVTDQAGQPVDARLLLSVIDEALLAVFPENLPDLLQTFYTSRSEGEIETRASATIRFAEVEGRRIERAEVREAEGSAAMAALRDRRKEMTEDAMDEFDKMAKRKGRLQDGLGLAGSGYGAGGLGGRGMGRGAPLRSRSARVMGGAGGRWRRSFDETAVFRHDLRTGPDGVASVVFTLPDSLTRWRVTARGVSRQTHLGEQRHRLRTQRDFFARLLLPPVLERGDVVRPRVRVFNAGRRPARTALALDCGGRAQRATITVPAGRSGEHLFAALETAAAAGEKLTCRLSAEAGRREDRIERSIPVVGRGVPVTATSQGLLGGDAPARATRQLTLAPGLRQPQLELRASRQLARFFIADRLDPLLFGDRPAQALVALELLELLGPDAAPALRDLVRDRLRRALIRLASAQSSDGGWGWNRDARQLNLATTAAAVRALARARPVAGELDWPFAQPALDRGAQALTEQLQRLAADDFSGRARVLFALAHLGRDRVPDVALHRLHRLRGQLPAGAQALLGLTWIELERPQQAAALAELLRPQLDATPALGFVERWAERRPLSELARIRGIELLARISPRDPAVERGRRWLMNRGRFLGWSFPRQAAAALSALRALESTRAGGGRARIAIQVNGRPAGELELGPDTDSVRLAVAPALLRPGDNEIGLQLIGTGGAWFRAELTANRVDVTPADEANGEGTRIRIQRQLEPVPADYRGRPIAAGFSVVAPRSPRWVNAVDRLPAGARLQVRLTVERDFDRPLDHCVLLERIPPGFELVAGSAGGHRSHLLRDGRRLAFYLAATGRRTTVRYQLAALNPGRYRFAPVRLLSLAYPDTSLLGPAADFQVLEPDAPRPEVRPTPLELYQRGMAAAEADDHATTIADLEALWTEHTLRGSHVQPVLEKLLLASIAAEDEPRILKYFELAKEKNPELVIPFEQLGKVRRAYRSQGAHEGGLHLARGVAEALFVRQLGAVGRLEALDEMAEAMDLLRRLLLAYPDNHLTAKAAYAFSQVMYGRADRIAAGHELEGFDRPGLLGEVVRMMAGFVGRHPDHPEAPAALFSLASALIELEQPERAVAWSGVGLRRHAEADLAPALAYLEAFAHFRRGDYGRSLELCRRVTREARAPDQAQMARYIMAQIHHARGRLDEALPLYRQVAERFADAAETVRELEARWFRIPEVVRSKRARRATLEVTARNIQALDLRVYQVDLMKLYLIKGSLRDLASVNLAGIKPILQRRLRLDAPRAAGPVERELALRLPGRGAYLVLARGGDQVAHSLVLTDALKLEVTEIPDAGRARLAVRDGGGRALPGARVQLKGNENQRFTAGHSDLRGIFVADSLEGTVTAIAKHRGAYGLYRGDTAVRVYAERSKALKQKRKEVIEVLRFDDDAVQGQLKNNAANREFFNQEVKGMSVQQAH